MCLDDATAGEGIGIDRLTMLLDRLPVHPRRESCFPERRPKEAANHLPLPKRTARNYLPTTMRFEWFVARRIPAVRHHRQAVLAAE